MPNDWTPQPPYPFDEPGKIDTEAGRTRRQIFKTALGTVIVAAVGYLSWTRILSPPHPHDSRKYQQPGGAPLGRVAVGNVAQLANAASPSPIMLGGEEAFVEYANGQPCVLSAMCPHQGCSVEWQAAVGKFVCPCHDSEFARDGNLLQGPSELPLTRIPSIVEGGTIYVQA